MKKQKNKFKFINKSNLILIIVPFLLFMCMVGHLDQIFISDIKLSTKANTYLLSDKSKVKYLSDLDYITDNNWSYNGWGGHSITVDKGQEGNPISLFIEGEKRSFAKGIVIHAKGQATYDISEYSNKFSRFIAYLGVDASKTQESNFWIEILASNDGNNWDSLHKTSNIVAKSNAVQVDLSVKGYKYLRIYVDPNGGNAADHGTIANARLVTEDFDKDALSFPRIHKLEYYDEILSAHDVEYNMENNYRLILEREIVNKFGYWTIQNLSEVSNDAMNTLNWIFDSNEVMEQMIEVGPVNAPKFLEDFMLIYSKHKEDLKESNGYVYQKMMIALSAAHSSDILLSPLRFGAYDNYNILTRYELLKDSFDNKKFKRLTTNSLTGTLVDNEWFKDYSIPLMRTVIHDASSDIDFKWLNGYSHDKIDFNFWVVPYISPNYGQPRFYDELNREKYTKNYLLDKYNVPYGVNSGQHYWMVVEGGGICWNQSRFGQALYRVNGIPAVGAYRPGHEFFFNYFQDENGNGYWTGRYGGWSGTGTTWGGAARVRYPLDWANKYFTNQHISGSNSASSSGYLYLAQANLNEYDKYKESLYYNLVSNSYTENNKKLETYFKALEINKLNLDTYDYIITLYKTMSADGTITSNDWYDLSLQIIDAYTYYPVAMYDLLKLTRPYLDGANKLDIDRLEKEALNKATNATSDLTNSAEGAREHANWLLGKAQPDPMTFSFDGENGGKIVRNPSYQIAWGYSLDGGKTYTEQVNVDSVTLTKEEIESITAENDIIISFMGLADYRFTINITNGSIANNLYANDLENRVIGINLRYEWRNSETDEWTSYATASPNNTGDKTLYVRVGATGHQLPSESRPFTFTEDNQSDTERYVNLSKIKLHSFSSQHNNTDQKAANALDGNINTMWHSNWNGSDSERYIVMELAEPITLTALEYYPRQDASNGRIKSARISVSMDGKNWTDVVTETNWPDDKTPKKVNIDAAKEAKYVKLTSDAYYGDGRSFISATMINLFEDMTNKPAPVATIAYSPEGPTSGNVTARIINMTNEAKVINNGGSDTYVFTDNGVFDFEIQGKYGKTSTITAKVDWIDRTAPTATIEYSIEKETNKFVVATLKPSEDIIVTSKVDYSVDNNGNVLDINGNILKDYTVDQDGNVKDPNGDIVTNINEDTHVFHDNGEFTFEFEDLSGNKGTATAKVDWIDRTIPTATLKYDVTSKTNKDVTATIIFNEKNVNVTNNNGKNTYTFKKNGEFTFEFEDSAGNMNRIIAKVDWIDKQIPTAAITYERVGNKVIVRVINPSKDVTFENGNGIYEFTRNGSYDIYFFDEVGNRGKVTAVINGLEASTNGSSDTVITNKNIYRENNSITDKEETTSSTSIVSENTNVNDEDKLNEEDTNLIKKDKKKNEVKHINKNSTSIYIIFITTIVVASIILICIFVTYKKEKTFRG